MVQPMMFYCWLKNKIQILACCSIKVSFKWPCRTSQDLINYNCLLQSSFNMSPNSNQFRTMHTNSYEKKITENKPRHTSLSPFPVVARFNPNPAQNQLHKLQMDPKTHPHRPLWLPLHSLKNSPLFCWNTTPTFKILPHHQVLNNQASKHTLKQRRHHYQYHYFPSCSKHLRKGTCTKATGISPLLPFPHQTIKQQSPPSLFRSCKEAEKLHLTQNKIFCCNS